MSAPLPGLRRFCGACKTWYPVRAGHLCPAEDGDRTVLVPLAAVRALVEFARDWMNAAQGHDSAGLYDEAAVVSSAAELRRLAEALGVDGL